MKTFKVLAAAAHPDDIEFMMAGTLLRLKDAGCQVHVWTLANGCCGSSVLSREQTAATRWLEVQASAKLAGGTPHPPLFDDLEIFYDSTSIARVGAVIREIKPDIILTQSPQDYMEDHQNSVRLVVTGAFSRGMKNFQTVPARETSDQPVAIYHASPHGLRDGLGQFIEPHFYIDIAPVLSRKRAMLACHASQKEWLDVSQGMDAYLNEMETIAREAGRRSGRCEFAEGWRRHSHLGFAPADFDPLNQVLNS